MKTTKSKEKTQILVFVSNLLSSSNSDYLPLAEIQNFDERIAEIFLDVRTLEKKLDSLVKVCPLSFNLISILFSNENFIRRNYIKL